MFEVREFEYKSFNPNNISYEQRNNNFEFQQQLSEDPI